MIPKIDTIGAAMLSFLRDRGADVGSFLQR